MNYVFEAPYIVTHYYYNRSTLRDPGVPWCRFQLVDLRKTTEKASVFVCSLSPVLLFPSGSTLIR